MVLLAQADRLGPKVGTWRSCYIQSNEPSELSQLLCHDDSTINIGIGIVIIINWKAKPLASPAHKLKPPSLSVICKKEPYHI